MCTCAEMSAILHFLFFTQGHSREGGEEPADLIAGAADADTTLVVYMVRGIPRTFGVNHFRRFVHSSPRAAALPLPDR